MSSTSVVICPHCLKDNLCIDVSILISARIRSDGSVEAPYHGLSDDTVADFTFDSIPWQTKHVHRYCRECGMGSYPVFHPQDRIITGAVKKLTKRNYEKYEAKFAALHVINMQNQEKE
jgi:hypothetical protein